MKEIREWLEQKGPYAAGVALYETHGKSQVVLKALRHGETEFTRATLRRELAKIAGEKPVRAVDTSAIRVRETATRVQVSPEKVGSSPEKVASSPEHPERRTWLATRAYAHAQLELVATEAERQELAEKILALSDQLTASYLAQVPAVVEPALELASLTDQGEIRRQLGNLRPRRSKLKNRLDRAGDLARIQAAITLLEAKLVPYE